MIYIYQLLLKVDLRAEVALALSKERKAIMPTITSVTPEPRKRLSFRERVHLYALRKFIRALMNNWPRRAAFWLGFTQAIRLDRLKG